MHSCLSQWCVCVCVGVMLLASLVVCLHVDTCFGMCLLFCAKHISVNTINIIVAPSITFNAQGVTPNWYVIATNCVQCISREGWIGSKTNKMKHFFLNKWHFCFFILPYEFHKPSPHIFRRFIFLWITHFIVNDSKKKSR